MLPFSLPIKVEITTAVEGNEREVKVWDILG
jgi:hypothetical protein